MKKFILLVILALSSCAVERQQYTYNNVKVIEDGAVIWYEPNVQVIDNNVTDSLTTVTYAKNNKAYVIKGKHISVETITFEGKELPNHRVELTYKFYETPGEIRHTNKIISKIR